MVGDPTVTAATALHRAARRMVRVTWLCESRHSTQIRCHRIHNPLDTTLTRTQCGPAWPPCSDLRRRRSMSTEYAKDGVLHTQFGYARVTLRSWCNRNVHSIPDQAAVEPSEQESSRRGFRALVKCCSHSAKRPIRARIAHNRRGGEPSLDRSAPRD